MDQKLNNKMVNGNLLCKDITESEIKTESGFTLTKETKFKTLQVLDSSEEDIPVGSEIVVPYHSGNAYGDLVIMNRKNIIYIK